MLIPRGFGRTGLRVSPLGALWATLPEDEAAAEAALRRAVAAGVNLHVVPAGPRRLRRERLLGRMLARLPASEPPMISVSVDAGPQRSAAGVVARIESASRRLGLRRLPVVELTGLGDSAALRAAMRAGGAFEGLIGLQRAGRVGSLMLHAPPGWENVEAGAGAGLFQALSVRYNCDRGAREIALMQAAASHGLAVVTRDVFGDGLGGRLAEMDDPPLYPSPEELICYNLTHPWISSALVEMHTEAEVERALAAAAAVGPPSAAGVLELRRRFFAGDPSSG